MMGFKKYKKELAEKDEIILELEGKVMGQRERYDFEVFKNNSLREENKELKETNKELLKENVELLEKIRELLKEKDK